MIGVVGEFENRIRPRPYCMPVSQDESGDTPAGVGVTARGDMNLGVILPWGTYSKQEIRPISLSFQFQLTPRSLVTLSRASGMV